MIIHEPPFAASERRHDLTPNTGMHMKTNTLAFIGVVLGIMAGINRLPMRSPAWGWRLAPYSIGSVAMFWVIQRTTLF